MAVAFRATPRRAAINRSTPGPPVIKNATPATASGSSWIPSLTRGLESRPREPFFERLLETETSVAMKRIAPIQARMNQNPSLASLNSFCCSPATASGNPEFSTMGGETTIGGMPTVSGGLMVGLWGGGGGTGGGRAGRRISLNFFHSRSPEVHAIVSSTMTPAFSIASTWSFENSPNLFRFSRNVLFPSVSQDTFPDRKST